MTVMTVMTVITTEEPLRVERDGDVAVVRLLHRFLDDATVRALDATTRSLAGDPGLRGVVVTGADASTFPAHYDLAEIAAGAEDLGVQVGPGLARAGVAAVRGLARVPGAAGLLDRGPTAGLLAVARFHDALRRLGQMAKVTVAAAGADALGGAFEVLLACDLRVLAEGAHVGLPETTAGFIPGAGGTQRLTRLVGPARALELVLDGRPLPAEEALALGVVSRVLPRDEVLGEAVALAHRLGDRGPTVVGAAKAAVREGGTLSLSRGLDVEAGGFVANASGPLARERLRAFVAQSDETSTPWTDHAQLASWRGLSDQG